MTKRRSDLTQEEALALLRSDQMQIADYIALCDERGWDKTHGLTVDHQSDAEASEAVSAKRGLSK